MEGQMFGQYRVTGKLGEGGMGVVYAAEHTLLGRPAAVKQLLPQLSRNQEMVERFFNEARAASNIRHPGIVEIYEVGWANDGSAFIVMELLQGETLGARRRRGPMRWSKSLGLVRQIAGALGKAHAKGIIHRDLKPENIFLVDDPEVPGGERIKLLDFGIARFAGSATGPKTRTGAAMGTPAYMAPEQCRGAAVDARTDLYALGCILFELCTGQPPFGHGADYDMYKAHIHDPPPAISSLTSGVPQEIEELFRRMLAKSPADRVPTAEDLIQRIDAAKAAMSQVRSGSHPVMAPVPSLPDIPTNTSDDEPGGSLSDIPASTSDDEPGGGKGPPTRPSSPRRARRDAFAATLAADEALAATQVAPAASAKPVTSATSVTQLARPPSLPDTTRPSAVDRQAAEAPVTPPAPVTQPTPDPSPPDTTVANEADLQAVTARAPARRLVILGGISGLAILGAITLMLASLRGGNAVPRGEPQIVPPDAMESPDAEDRPPPDAMESPDAEDRPPPDAMESPDAEDRLPPDTRESPDAEDRPPPDAGATPAAVNEPPPPRPPPPRKVPPRWKTTEAKITIRSDPPGAEVYLDTRFFGTTPREFSLRRGDYEFRVELRLAGYQSHEFVFRSTEDVRKYVKLKRSSPKPAPARSAGPSN